MKNIKILIKHFPNLNNYGTAMMGLVAIQALVDIYRNVDLTFYCDFDEFLNFNELQNELKGNIVIKCAKSETVSKNNLIRKIIKYFKLLFYFERKKFDKIIVLGGDDLSEYYSSHGAAYEIIKYWKLSFHTQVYLLGQTMGPFYHRVNRFMIKNLIKHLYVYARDPWTVKYMENDFGARINLTTDLAISDLPRQNNKNKENRILERYNLLKDQYITIIISGLQSSSYYCSDRKIYLRRFVDLIKLLLGKNNLITFKICLLSHTFKPYQDESSYISEIERMIPKDNFKKVVFVKDRILPTNARFIIGNGLFTITGRMHAAISSFQMYKPAICLSYGAKFEGVIGEGLKRPDLIIQANNNEKWYNEDILKDLDLKINYILQNYQGLQNQISLRIKKLKPMVYKTFKEISN